MSGPAHGPDADDEPLVRPFLGAPAAAGPHPGGQADPDAAQEVRPYVMTAGRTRVGPDVSLETLVVVTPAGRCARASFEAAQVLRLCAQRQSVAEVSAHLRLPVGVVRVLVADLIAADLLTATAPPARHLADDVEFLERLILGVAAL
jgi:Protein of unknown function (DUF742)